MTNLLSPPDNQPPLPPTPKQSHKGPWRCLYLFPKSCPQTCPLLLRSESFNLTFLYARSRAGTRAAKSDCCTFVRTELRVFSLLPSQQSIILSPALSCHSRGLLTTAMRHPRFSQPPLSLAHLFRMLISCLGGGGGQAEERGGVSTVLRQSCLRGWDRPWRGNSLTRRKENAADCLLCHQLTWCNTAMFRPGGWNCGGHRQVGCPQEGLGSLVRGSDGSGWASYIASKDVFHTGLDSCLFITFCIAFCDWNVSHHRSHILTRLCCYVYGWNYMRFNIRMIMTWSVYFSVVVLWSSQSLKSKQRGICWIGMVYATVDESQLTTVFLSLIQSNLWFMNDSNH